MTWTLFTPAPELSNAFESNWGEMNYDLHRIVGVLRWYSWPAEALRTPRSEAKCNDLENYLDTSSDHDLEFSGMWWWREVSMMRPATEGYSVVNLIICGD